VPLGCKKQAPNIAIFSPEGRAVHAGEFLYKKSVLIAKGSYRPPTLRATGYDTLRP
jgi:hypothetical protein